MITISQRAVDQFKSLMQAKGQAGAALRLSINGRGLGGFRHELRFVSLQSRSADDDAVEIGGLTVLIGRDAAEKLEGASIDYVEEQFRSGFQIDNPNPLWTDPVSLAVQEVIDKQINPGVAVHGGYVSLLEVRDRVAYVALGGGCQGCGLADVTLKKGIDVMIREAVPDIEQVVDTTDHAAGTNPYYQPAKGGQSPL
ncbi:MAG: iron-sulfur cluster assembly accessory protein, partial [Anaerolineales bacterium]